MTAVALAAALSACSPSKGEKSADAGEPAASSRSQAALTVAVEPVRHEPLQHSVEATGTVAAWEDLTIGSEVGGLAITAVHADLGDAVKKGDVLAELDDSLLRAQVAQQQAAIAEAQANADYAEADVDRARLLSGNSDISRQTMQQREATLKTSQAKIQQAQASLSELQAKLAQTRIVAPADGTVSQRKALIGTVASAGGELFHLIRDNRLEVQAKVPEAELPGIAAGQSATARDAAGNTFTGSVRKVGPVVDAATRLGTVYVALPQDTTMKPGMFARVEISTEPRLTLTVPESALVWRNGASSVFAVASGNTAKLLPVTTGARQNGRVAIDGDVSPGDRVVVSGAGFLNDGDAVRIAVADADLGGSAEAAAR
ncbi:HlyD family secretion protein [Faunimonas pinastri]|uniref:HlyD family secretion protein n=1 Tax=Faunimonas pinastri TaxID=1855383 RepID=A0A1H9A1A6_9HYPH|nr:efflux RND transporter periplasmic adaptor subunit [Faunimonas pinastri]SEP70293.1 HlyD family secretion protein [Faunimonas pinastri]